jgi:CBS domain containing-hemolysin-like protein
VAVVTVLAAVVLLAGVQVMVRSLALRKADVVAPQMAPVMRVCQWLLWPITSLLRIGIARLPGGVDEDSGETIFMTEEGLRLLINVAEEEETILDSEREMIASILEMDETVVREVMVPRIDMVAVNVETNLREALEIIIQAGHSRIPVYEGNIDRVVGFLYAKDLLKCFRDGRTDVPIHDLLRPAYFVPVSKKVNILFREMQKRRVHVAVVVDEYGGTAGLVSIEDLIEEIVGEIQDEYDAQVESYIQPMGPHAFLLNSRLDIYTLSELLGLDLEDEETDTLGGLIYSRMGRVPEQGESVEEGAWRFTVLSLDGRRIDQVRAEMAASEAEPDVGQANAWSDARVSRDSNSMLNQPALD